MKYADKRGSPCAVIQGGDEKAQGRGADQGPDRSAPRSRASKDRDDYLKKQAEAQFAVPGSRTGRGRAQLLARHGIFPQARRVELALTIPAI